MMRGVLIVEAPLETIKVMGLFFFYTPKAYTITAANELRTSLGSLRLVVRTLASHAGNRGSNPLGSANFGMGMGMGRYRIALHR